MQLSPRHDSVPIVVDLDDPADLAALVTGQRRRFAELLAGLDADAWTVASRCDAWTVREVVAHLVTVNGYWAASVRAALEGAPLRLLRSFDPVSTPAALVRSLEGVAPAELLARLVASHEALAEALAAVDGAAWSLPAETPLGHVALAELAAHALWDALIHERDVTVPLGLDVEPHAREVGRALRYGAGLAASLAVLHDLAPADALALAPDGAAAFTVEPRTVEGLTQIVVRGRTIDDDALPCLQGPALSLLEAISLRAPMPTNAPAAWTARVGAIGAAFDAS